MHHGQSRALAVHVGFWRPDTSKVGEFLESHPGQILISTAALGTFPPIIKVSTNFVGALGDMQYHLAIGGFGFEIEDPTILPVAAELKDEKQSLFAPNKPRGWVSVLASNSPEFVSQLLTAGIWDEDSYLELELNLPLEVRHQVALDRFFILAAERPNPNTIFDKLSFAPPWLLELGTNWLNLSVRSANVCRASEIHYVKDFLRYGLKRLQRLPNLGQKSIFEMSLALVDLLTSGKPLRVEGTQRFTSISADPPEHPQGVDRPELDVYHDDLKHRSAEIEKDIKKSVDDDIERFSNFIDGFANAATRLTENERGIWAARIGYKCKAMTLQEIAVDINLTRERVRQLETKIYRSLDGHPFWAALSSRILKHLKDRNSELYLHGLSVIDPWFQGVDDVGHALGHVCEHMPSLGFYVFSASDTDVVSQISKAEWLAAIDDGKSLLKALVDHKPLESEVRYQVQSLFFDKGRELQTLLWREVSRLGVWTESTDADRKLVGYGKTAQALVLGILESSETPLHVDELLAKAKEISSETYNVNSIRYMASEVGYLYGRGTYGLMKHCPLSLEDLQSVRAEVEDIMAGGGSQKQWHSNEIFDELLDRGFDFEGRLTKYIVNIALVGSQSIVYLKRMIYGLKGQWSESAESRLDVRQAVIALLEESGKPLTTDEVRNGLANGRGVNVHFQIFPSPPLIRLRPGLWGLEHRDVHLPDAKKLVLTLLKDLSYRQSGLHTSEVAKFLGLSHEDDVALIVSLGQRDGLRMDKGQYCYLEPWGESRRISIQDAATAILRSYLEGIPLSELHLMVERVTKRPVPRPTLSTVLQNIDASFDSRSNLWKLHSAVEDDILDAEDPTATVLSLSL
jgi:hypothetical protein